MSMVRLQNCWIFSLQSNASGSSGWLPDVFIGCFSINVSWRLCLFGGYAVCLLAAYLFIYYVCGWSLALFANVCTGFLTEGEGSIRLTSLYLVQISCFLYWSYIFLFYKITNLHEEVDSAEPSSPSVRGPWYVLRDFTTNLLLSLRQIRISKQKVILAFDMKNTYINHRCLSTYLGRY